MKKEEIMENIKTNSIEKLVANDELNNLIAKDENFDNFKEAKIEFSPNFKKIGGKIGGFFISIFYFFQVINYLLFIFFVYYFVY